MNLMWESIRMGVCRKCIDGNGKGDCRLPTDELCPLETYFPAITEAILNASPPLLDSGARALRSQVCNKCLYGSAEECRKRNAMECALERYLPVVIDRIAGFKRSA